MAGQHPDLSPRTMAISSVDEASGGCDDVTTSCGSGQGIVSDLLSNFHCPPSVLEGISDITVDKDCRDYVPTPALEEADEILQSTGRVILCGPPGSGKTTLAYALSRRSRKQGFCVYTLGRIEQWTSHIGGRERSIVLLDGNFGRIFLDSQQHMQWNMLMDTILEQLKLEMCRLVITAYPHVLRELQLLENKHKSPILDDNAIVHLTDTLPQDVKIKLLTFHLDKLGLEPDREHHIMEEVLERDVSGPVFPWCCDYMVNHWNSSDHPTAIFGVPAEAHVQLLKEMVVNKVHGRLFAAVLALTMKGVGHFLHHLSQAEPHLENLGLRQIDDDTLAIYADILQGSVLLEGGFSSRVIYEAAGLALGRFFRLPTLLRVCDVPFLVQYVNTTATGQGISDDRRVKLCVTVGSVASCSMDPKRCTDDCRALVERIYTEIIQGNLQDICQHPCLQCPKFLQELDNYCSNGGKRMDQLLKAEDPVHHQPLVYWSIFNPSPNLTHWCLSKSKKDSRSLAPVLIACSLMDHLAQSSECRLPLSLQDALGQKDFKHPGRIMIFPLPGDHQLTDLLQNQADFVSEVGIAQERLQYLCDPSLPITPDIFTMLITRENLILMVEARHDWYLVFRLLSDKKVDQTDKDGNSLLHIAVESGESAAVRLCLRSGAMITRPNKCGATPYQLAHKTRLLALENRSTEPILEHLLALNKTELQLLLLQELNVNHKDKRGWSGLLVACREGWEEVANLYIELGAHVNVAASESFCDLSGTEDGDVMAENSTPLHYACKKGMQHTVSLLIQHQANVTSRTLSGDTALHFAPLCSSPTASAAMTRSLAEAGAEVNAQNKSGDTPLLYAAKKGYSDTVELLVHYGAEVNVQNIGGDTPLLWAIKAGQTNTSELLVTCGADVNRGNKWGDTPLLYAAKNGYSTTIDLLVCSGADVNLQNKRGDTPLLWAIMNGHKGPLELLVRCGADVNKENKGGVTPLMHAARMGYFKTAKMLIGQAACVNTQNKEGTTPLICALLNGRIRTAEVLVHYGADVNAVNNDGATPLRIAKHYPRLDMKKLLKRRQTRATSLPKKKSATGQCLSHTCRARRRRKEAMLINPVMIPKLFYKKTGSTEWVRTLMT